MIFVHETRIADRKIKEASIPQFPGAAEMLPNSLAVIDHPEADRHA